MSIPALDSDDFPKLIYRQTFEAIYEYLEERLRTDPTFTPEDIRQFLKDAYTRQGDDWIGRGVLETKKLDAVVAAHECFLADWETEARADTVPVQTAGLPTTNFKRINE